MTAPEITLAKATAKGGSYEAMVGGGVSQFSAAEVGHALAGFKQGDGKFERLPEGSYRILLLRYADGQEVDVNILVRELLSDLRQRMDWVDRCAYGRICRTALGEFLRAKRCENCGGRQTVMAANLVKTCPTCEGFGYQQLSMRARAAELDIPASSFSNGPAKDIYLKRLKRLVEWEEIGLRRVVGKTR